jgi:hypothetical protein
MSSPDNPDRDLRLERLGDRDGRRHAHLGVPALVGSPLAGASSTREYLAAYQALIDAVFTAPGAVEWLLGLRRRFGADSVKEVVLHQRAASDAIRPANPGPGRP